MIFQNVEFWVFWLFSSSSAVHCYLAQLYPLSSFIMHKMGHKVLIKLLKFMNCLQNYFDKSAFSCYTIKYTNKRETWVSPVSNIFKGVV